MSQPYVYAIEATVWVAGASMTQVGHYATAGLITAPTDTPANTVFAPRLLQPALVQRDAFDSRTTMGASRVGYGDCVLNNADGGLDAFVSLGFDGRPLTIRRGHPGAAYPSAYVTILSGTMQQAIFDSQHVTLKVRDQQQLLTVPLQTTKYAGSNVLPAGLEGVSDLAGKPKPVCEGVVFNISPPCVNTSKLIYQVNDVAVASVDAVRDRGVPLSNRLYLIGAGNGATAYIYTSPDLLAWTRHTSGFGTGNVRSFAFGTGVFVAVGGQSFTASKIATSADGKTWTLQTSPFGATEIRSVCWNGSVFVAGDDTGQIATSPNGTAWTLRTSGISTPIKNLIWNGSVFIAEGGGILRTSSDGVTWTTRTSGFGATITYALAYSVELGLSVLVGDAGKISTSPDGLTWTLQTSPDASATFVDVGYGNGRLVAVDINTGNTATSINGVVWMVAGNAGLNAFAQGQGLRFGNGSFVLVGSGAFAWSSTDGVHGQRIGTDGAFASDNLNCTGYFDLAALSTYANSTDLLDDTLAPPPGLYKVCPSTGYFRLGSRPQGTITCDVTQGATSADRTTAQVFTRFLQRAGRTSSDWSAADIIALDTANSAEVGYWTDEETTCVVAINAVVPSVGAWWNPDSTDVFRIAQLSAPSGSPVVSFVLDHMVEPLEQVQSNDPGDGVPTYQSTVRYAKNYTVQQSTELAGEVSDPSRAAFGTAWLDAVVTDATVLTAHPLSIPVIEESALAHAADAVAEATRRQALRGALRQWFQITVEMDDTNITIELGSVILLTHKRFGLSGGKLLRVLGLQPDAAQNQLVLSAWG